MRWFTVISIVAITMSSIESADTPLKLKPVIVWTGFDSKQPKDFYALSRSQKDWLPIWDEHCGQKETGLGSSACPDVDFDSYMLVSVFRKTSRIKLSEIVEEKECVRVRYKPHGNQIVYIPGKDNTIKVIEAGRGEIDHDKPYLLSYAFIVIPKTSKTVVLEEDVQRTIGKTPIWEERATFPSTPVK